MPKLYVQSNMPAFANDCYYADHARHRCTRHGNCLQALRTRRCEFADEWEATAAGRKRRGRKPKDVKDSERAAGK
jgi:hypothetical protein